MDNTGHIPAFVRPPLRRGVSEWPYAIGGGGGVPPPKTQVTIVGKIYHWENLVGPFLLHRFLGPPPSTPPSNTSLPLPPSPLPFSSQTSGAHPVLHTRIGPMSLSRDDGEGGGPRYLPHCAPPRHADHLKEAPGAPVRAPTTSQCCCLSMGQGCALSRASACGAASVASAWARATLACRCRFNAAPFSATAPPSQSSCSLLVYNIRHEGSPQYVCLPGPRHSEPCPPLWTGSAGPLLTTQHHRRGGGGGLYCFERCRWSCRPLPSPFSFCAFVEFAACAYVP